MNKQQLDLENGRAVYGHLLSYVRPYWKAFIFVLLGMAIAATMDGGFVALIKPMLDGTFVEKDPFYIKVIPLALIGIFVLRGIGGFCANYFMAWVSRHVIKDLRAEMFDKVLSLPTAFYDRQSSGKIISKLIYDVEQVAEASGRALTIIVQDSLTIIVLLSWMAYLNWQLTLLFLTIGPVMTALVVWVSKRLRRYAKRLQNSVGDVTHISQETIDAHRVVKVFGGQDYERAQFEKANEYNRRQYMKIISTNSASVPIVELMAALLLAAIIYLATQPHMQETVTVGTFMSFISAMLMLFPPIKRMTTLNVILQRGIAAAQSIFSFLQENSEVDTGSKSVARVQGAVEFKNIHMQYDQSKGPVLRNINLNVQAGESIALVGRSGSGKSSLVSLLPRFYLPSGGEILLDGMNVGDIKLSDMRAQISLVSQDVTLFNDSVRHNIAYGRLEDTPDEKIIAAAKAAHAWEFIEQLPEGLDTQVGEHGLLLSGGQRQRLAIARAILKDSPILILDEATSALDTESERFIQAALDNLMQNRTTFMIAHRLSTIEKADRIIVLDKGEIIEIGSHRELLEKNGHYAKLHSLQFSALTTEQ
ncbi:MAG: lipid A export permease/ATP-binding protein MsbA [Gammaproteobacteria bacterium]|nr:lipid A export permease/ATP-binding protein MsbA [Gammaproteobacteria bacterium]MDH5728660.1 lipid A export permease/ATP-binding protein MsbA [Gammaproteobacteria bacterium]